MNYYCIVTVIMRLNGGVLFVESKFVKLVVNEPKLVPSLRQFVTREFKTNDGRRGGRRGRRVLQSEFYNCRSGIQRRRGFRSSVNVNAPGKAFEGALPRGAVEKRGLDGGAFLFPEFEEDVLLERGERSTSDHFFKGRNITHF